MVEAIAMVLRATHRRASLFMRVRVRGEPEAFTPTLRRLAAEVDPTLRLHDD